MAPRLLAHLEFLMPASHWCFKFPHARLDDSLMLHHRDDEGRCKAIAKHAPLGRQGSRHSALLCTAGISTDTAPYYRQGSKRNAKGKVTLAHPDYPRIQDWWHPDRNQGKTPADYPHKSNRRVWLLCPGCIHGCGRRHEWEARVSDLTRHGGHIVCPYCDCRGSGGRFCECRSVAGDPQLFREWHPSNPPADQVARSSRTKRLWLCLKGHPSYEASCDDRCQSNSGCPECGVENSKETAHPTVEDGRPDLAAEWDPKNDKLPSEATLGSSYRATWICGACQRTWEAEVRARALRGRGCPACGYANRHKPRKFGAD